ncbi:hypothetical protein FA15DRAFT_730186 [Coprinopsis marcescibilis]|uniref:Uncharacterized protein n=1 Tax=Coprinopsis marcescibilis TaxID=230819 RepID=A0A5C3KEB8_COPMA|nr:hypothetical protein FA15DRAFT_730186 [Coprinopsis marcescibilis]
MQYAPTGYLATGLAQLCSYARRAQTHQLQHTPTLYLAARLSWLPSYLYAQWALKEQPYTLPLDTYTLAGSDHPLRSLSANAAAAALSHQVSACCAHSNPLIRSAQQYCLVRLVLLLGTVHTVHYCLTTEIEPSHFGLCIVHLPSANTAAAAHSHRISGCWLREAPLYLAALLHLQHAPTVYLAALLVRSAHTLGAHHAPSVYLAAELVFWARTLGGSDSTNVAAETCSHQIAWLLGSAGGSLSVIAAAAMLQPDNLGAGLARLCWHIPMDGFCRVGSARLRAVYSLLQKDGAPGAPPVEHFLMQNGAVMGEILHIQCVWPPLADDEASTHIAAAEVAIAEAYVQGWHRSGSTLVTHGPNQRNDVEANWSWSQS